MSDRQEDSRRFLAATDWADAIDEPLAGDASNRSYRRLTHPVSGQTAVLMNAPPEKGEDIRPFVHIARYLSELGLSAPHIMATDEANGFLLLEDLGDDLYARVLERTPEQEAMLYKVATDALVHLHQVSAPDGVPEYSVRVMADFAALVFDWYVMGVAGENPQAKVEFTPLMAEFLASYAPETDVLIQRDYHAENLLWLPLRTGVARVGLLDFQDGARGHRAYDLVSLLQDARRDVSSDVEQDMIQHYIMEAGIDHHSYLDAYHVLGVQRNLRILGVFGRLCIRDGKAHYVDFIPRVWNHLMRDLDYPVLHPLRDLLLPVLPQPTDTNLQRLKDQCLTSPVL